MQIIKTASTHKVLHLAALLIADFLFFLLSDPGHLSFIFMIIGWLLVAITVYVGCIYGARLSLKAGLIKSQKRINLVLLSSVIYLVLVLQAVGQLSLRDIAALLPLAIIGYLYFRRVKSDKVAV